MLVTSTLLGNLMALMRSHRRILADGHNNGWSEDHYAQHEHYSNSISRLLAEGRKEALAEWRQNMTNLGHAARWVRDGLVSPATNGSDILTPAERGQQILEMAAALDAASRRGRPPCWCFPSGTTIVCQV